MKSRKKTKKKPATKTLTSKQVGQKYGFRSGLEEKISQELQSQGVDPQYESHQIRYTQPVKRRTYTPDFILPNGIIIETKGRFMTADRQKHLMIQNEYPDLDIRFVFNNPRSRISKTSKTTYAKWCEKNGFKYAKGSIPAAWLKERGPGKAALRHLEKKKKK